MKTEEKDYAEYLRGKFLPGRQQYLEFLVYPRYLRELGSPVEVWDLGFGNGEFLVFCGKKGISAHGIDSNPDFVAKATERGLKAELDDITQMRTIPDASIHAALSDNVLEHLDRSALAAFFNTLPRKLAKGGVFLAVVPGEKGFTRDPTHRTFIDKALLGEMLSKSGLEVQYSFRHPVNARWMSGLLYLNMTVFRIRKAGSRPLQ